MATLGELRLERDKLLKIEQENKALSEAAKQPRWETIYLGRSLYAQYQKEQVQAKITALERPKHVSDAGVALIAGFEGGQGKDGLFHPYRDIAGVWTIGYGHTGSLEGHAVGSSTPPLSKERAIALLRRDLEDKYVPAVLGIGVPLNQNQLDALVSFVFNTGTGSITVKTTIGIDLRAKRYIKSADDMLAWNKARINGVLQPIAGLTHRRTVERSLFLR